MSIERHITILRALSHTKPRKNTNLSRAIFVSPSSIARSMQILKKHKLITSKNGPEGGYRLIKPFNEFMIKDIVPLIDTHDKVFLTLAGLLSDKPITALFKNDTAL